MRRALDSEHWISQGRDVLSMRDAVFTVSPISVYLNPCDIYIYIASYTYLSIIIIVIIILL